MSIEFKNKKIGLLGAGISNISLANYLVKLNNEVFISEELPEEKIKKNIKKLSPLVKYEVGKNTEKILENDIIVRSPGIPYHHPLLQKAVLKGIPVLTELEVSYQIMKKKIGSSPLIIAITGTNGKTTTTALTGKIVSSFKKTVVCGNIGTPLINFIDFIEDDTIIVCEVSSYQLEDIIEFKPHIGCILNITEDHLEHHKSMQNYINAKFNMFKNQTSNDYAILNYNDKSIMSSHNLIKSSKKLFFSKQENLSYGCWLNKEKMEVNFIFGNINKKIKINTTLPGEHNLENIIASVCCSVLVGVPDENIQKTISEFKGVEHRLEFVRELDGVIYINDSKSTNVDSTYVAIKSFSGNIHLILGGRDKGAPYTPLIPLIKEKVKSLLLIGEATEIIYNQLKSISVAIYKCGTLENAVKKAKTLAQKGDIVLLSPACSSFDQFENFEHRGKEFKRIVNNL